MSWTDAHRQSESFAVEAAIAKRNGDLDKAVELYAAAARFEEEALSQLDQSKIRTLGIITVSAVSLLFKAGNFIRAEQLACSMLTSQQVPAFATDELRLLLQAIWIEQSKRSAGLAFLPGQVTVSVKGGAIVMGGAPLDLIVEKVQTIQSIFYRTIEFIRNLPFRSHGGPIREIQDACRPWLFQAPPGSYQFSVAIQQPPAQLDFFKDPISSSRIAQEFFEIVRAASSDDESKLNRIVPDDLYRSAFLKLSRNLAPTGKTFERMDLRVAGDETVISLVPESRSLINKALRANNPKMNEGGQEILLAGTLRAVHLDKDWLDLAIDNELVHIIGLKDTIDDVIGPMVNRPVLVRSVKSRQGKYSFIDIELDE